MLDIVLSIAVSIATIAGILAFFGFLFRPKAGKVFLNFFVLAMLIVVAVSMTRTGDYNIFVRGIVGVYDELKGTAAIVNIINSEAPNVLQKLVLVGYTVLKCLSKILLYNSFMLVFSMTFKFWKRLLFFGMILYVGLFIAAIAGTLGINLNSDYLLIKYEGYMAVLFFSFKAGKLILNRGKEEGLLHRFGRNFQNHRREEDPPSIILVIGVFVVKCYVSMFLDAAIWVRLDRVVFYWILGA